MKSLNISASCDVSRKVWGDSRDQQDICEVSRKSLGTSSVAVKSLGRVLETSRIAVVSRKSLDTSRIAVKTIGRVWIPAE